MSFGAVGLALSVVQGISQINEGKAKQAEANYNATILEGEANLIQEQKNIEYGQYQRQKGRVLSTSMANVAKSGIAPQGSAMAVMLETQTQLNIDQAIGQFNLEQNRQFKMSQAEATRRQGKQYAASGYTNAFTTILKGASDYALYQRTSFDSPLSKKTSAFGGGVYKYDKYNPNSTYVFSKKY